MSIIYFARWILLENGEILQNGALAVEGRTISFIGSRSRARKNASDRIINLGDTLLLPGMINTHIHLEDTVLRGISRSSDETFASWSAKKQTRINQHSKEQISSLIRLAVRELVSNGVTTVVDSSRSGYSEDVLNDEPVRAWIINEFHPQDASLEGELSTKFIEKRMGKAARPQLKKGIGPYSLYSVSPEVQKRFLTYAAHEGIPWVAHVAESAEELQAFAEHEGDLFFQITRKRPWPFGETPLGSLYYALEQKLIPSRGICLHCNYAGAAELSALASLDATIVHCPGYSELMNHKSLPIDVVLNRGVRLCIGTEGECAPGSLSLFDELYLLKQQYPHIPAVEMVRWVTQNPADALGVGDRLGSLSEGKFADLIGVRFSWDETADILDEMLFSDIELVLIMIDGQEVIVNY
ncbi:MAG: amidohydrolase family protein [Chitinispirillaceae bacterium]|nr:amidohydrolase family protein [Chitinispirillaceae bacterium]